MVPLLPLPPFLKKQRARSCGRKQGITEEILGILLLLKSTDSQGFLVQKGKYGKVERIAFNIHVWFGLV